MSKRFSAFLYPLLGACLLAGCGNKGELFLPPDAALARELESVNERTGDAVAEPALDEVTNKQKRRQDQAPAQPSQ